MADHQMKSMKLNKKEAKEMAEGVEVDRPQYPYGLSIHLDDEAMGKLNLSELPKVGTGLMLNAKVLVNEVSSNARAGDKKPRQSMSLQITDMELLSNPDGKSASDELYGD